MPEIFKISWSLEVLEYFIFYIPQFGKFPEYAWDTLYSFGCKISGICMGYSKFHNLGICPEYDWDILDNF